MLYETRQMRFGYAAQTVFTTPAADNIAVNETTIEPLDIDPDVKIHELPQDHGSRNAVIQNTIHSTAGSGARFTTKGPVSGRDISEFLYAHFQKVVEAGTTGFAKTFTYFIDHPIFASNEGHFLTWFRRFPMASSSQKVGGCIAKRLKISGERDGILNFEADWIGRGTISSSANPSGVWTPDTGEEFVYFNDMDSAVIDFTTAGVLPSPSPITSPVPMTLQSFEIESNYEVEKVGHDAVGFNDFGFKSRAGSFKLKMLRDTTADSALSAIQTGALITIVLSIGILDITFTGKIEKLDYDAEGLLVNNISGKLYATYTAGAWGQPLTIVCTDGYDKAWPAA